jgi:hypothetical protein
MWDWNSWSHRRCSGGLHSLRRIGDRRANARGRRDRRQEDYPPQELPRRLLRMFQERLLRPRRSKTPHSFTPVGIFYRFDFSIRPSAAKAARFLGRLTARLKPCPDEMLSYFRSAIGLLCNFESVKSRSLAPRGMTNGVGWSKHDERGFGVECDAALRDFALATLRSNSLRLGWGGVWERYFGNFP